MHCKAYHLHVTAPSSCRLNSTFVACRLLGVAILMASSLYMYVYHFCEISASGLRHYCFVNSIPFTMKMYVFGRYIRLLISLNHETHLCFQKSTLWKISLLGMNKIRKTPAGSDCPIVLSEEFIKIDDDNVYKTPIMAGKDILEFVQSSKNIIEADENEMKNAAPVPTSSEIRNVMKSNRSYIDAHFNGEMNNKMDDIEQFVHNLILKKNNAKENIRLFSKTPINVLFFKKFENFALPFFKFFVDVFVSLIFIKYIHIYISM
ncbi:DDE-1 domain-containing protein [Trichonephila clavipes]|nr:DDE-1 domain-containing protein [Trichonephila clavipes]